MKMKNGIYLIVDPSLNNGILIGKIKKIISEEITAIQIWDNFKTNESPIELVNEIVELCHTKNIPVLINNQWELLKKTNLDGVHFDKIPPTIFEIKRELNRSITTGITCNNDLSLVKWAEENQMDYISFCSMFPSDTANSCELVDFDTIREARKITNLPIFLAGGIRLENIEKLNELDYSGIAVVSGIMNSENPTQEIIKYIQKLKMK